MIREIEKQLKLKKIEKYEIYIAETNSNTTYLEKNKISFSTKGNTKGVGIRLVKNKRIGFASTSNLNNYKNCIDKAIQISKLNNKDKNFMDFQKKSKYQPTKSFNKKLLDFDANKIKQQINSNLDLIKESNPKIKTPQYIFDLVNFKAELLNSNGVYTKRVKAYFEEDCELHLNKKIVAFENISSDLPNKIKLKEALEELKVNKKAQTKTEETTAILDPEVIQQIMAKTYEYSINGENINQGKSKLENKINQKIINAKITITDDPTKKYMLSTKPFDAEGTSSKIKKIVEQGKLKSFIYDTYNAFYKGKKSTGNAVRSYFSTPSISTTNTVINPGKTSINSLKNIKKGVYIKLLTGIHTMDSTTGNFSQGVSTGYIIENGKITKRIKDSMVAGNFYEMLNQSITLSKETKTIGSYNLPYIKIPKLKTIGK